ncbi:MAG TPA: hypothetical protein VK118_09545 [Tetragenococcus sp.]|nr:hypothetical protein [Tetragenococcus sp.]
MKIREVNAALDEYSEKELKKLVKEMYKKIPKKMKEEKEIDSLITDMTGFLKQKKNKQEETVDFATLKQEIETFTEYAYNQYYLAPNSYVKKKERPKWRFKVKNYLKQLQSFSMASEEGVEATELLIKLYEVMAYGCAYYIFSSDDPYRSIGLGQMSFYDLIVKRLFIHDISKPTVKKTIKLVIDNENDRETIDDDLWEILIQNLKTVDMKEMAIEESKLLLKINSQKEVKASSGFSDLTAYKKYEFNNSLTRLVFHVYIFLGETRAAINFFKAHMQENDREVQLYILLKLLEHYDLTKEWVSELEKALKNGVTPRRSLLYQYEDMPDKFKQLKL